MSEQALSSHALGTSDERTSQEPDVTVVVPVRDEEGSIAELLSRVRAALTSSGHSYEVIVVDDGSRDQTFHRAGAAADRDPFVRVVRLRGGFGQATALSVGFARARGRVVVTIDGDLQDDPADIPRLVSKLDEGFDLVSGWRIDRQEPFWRRRLPSRVANRLISAVTGVRLHDYGCGLKAYRREVLRGVDLYAELHRFVPALASWQGATITELPVAHASRRSGRSKYGLDRTFRVLLDLLTVGLLQSFRMRPMHIFGFVGLTGMLAGFGIAAYLATLKLATGADIGSRPLLLLGVLLLVVGVQFLGMGLIGELIIRSGSRASTGDAIVREEVNPGPIGPRQTQR